jgi:2'-5' RNA ligase
VAAFGAGLLLAALGACATRPAPAASAPPSGARPAGSLFSTIPCAATQLGKEWSELRDEAEARFPGLRLTRVEDLHVTVVYVGGGWKTDDLDAIRAHALVWPRETISFRPEVVRMGRDGQVVAVEMHGAPEAWGAFVVTAKGEMNRLGLKKADRYDLEFRPHVTLASARRSPPDATDVASLDELRSWLAVKLTEDASRFTVTVGPDTPIRLWLAGTTRPPGAPEYVDLEDVLARPGPISR